MATSTADAIGNVVELTITHWLIGIRKMFPSSPNDSGANGAYEECVSHIVMLRSRLVQTLRMTAVNHVTMAVRVTANDVWKSVLS